MNRLKRKNAAPAAQGVPAAGINQVTWKERLASYRRDPLSLALRLVVSLAAAITAAVLLALPDGDGGLIGGACLMPADFVEIINAANQE